MNQAEILQLPTFDRLWQDTLGWKPNLQQQQQFQQVYEQILKGNRQLNLTRITAPESFWEKHLWDSLVGVAQLGLANSAMTKTFRVIDVGTGAGFPGLPIAIAFPHWKVTLLDSTRKKIAFLNSLVTRLHLTNVRTLVGRAEAIGREDKNRESYDLALIRAVGQASVCAEYTLPFVKTGGLAILYRGHWQEEDSQSLQPVVTKLGSEIEAIETGTTPLSQSVRNCVYIRKHTPTSPQFPRPVGVPTQQPL